MLIQENKIKVEYKKILQLVKEDLKVGLEALFNSYSDYFYNYIIKNWNLSEDEAWEVIYQTFDKLLTRLPDCEFSSQNQFNAYIFKVLKSYLLKSYRKKQTLKSKIEVISIEDATNDGIREDYLSSLGFDKSFIRRNLSDEETDSSKMKDLKKALLLLEEFDREILLLRVQNFSYDEIAQLLKVDNNQLKVKHYRAKQKLLKIIENF